MFKNKNRQMITEDMEIYFVCDAGMGSSALGASLLQRKLKSKGIVTKVNNCSLEDVPGHVRYIIAHHNFEARIEKKFPYVASYFLKTFMDDKEYERIVNDMLFRKDKEKKTEILNKENIRLNCKAETSDDAIVAMGNLLLQAGYISEGYIQGMLNRDHSLSVYIGNDIAIPHGEYDVKDCVLQTGIAVMIYPDGVAWGGENRARIVIGIAAKNDDHMTILSNIADKLGDMNVVEQVVAGDVSYIYDVLRGDAA